MSKNAMSIQFGESVTGDFSENTWTFKMPKGYSIASGKYAIVPLSQYQIVGDPLNLLEIKHISESPKNKKP